MRPLIAWITEKTIKKKKEKMAMREEKKVAF